MYVWVTADPVQDPLDTEQDRSDLLSFVSAQSVTTLFLDMYQYLGAANDSPDKTAAIQSVISGVHAVGGKVFALAGNTDWSIPAVQGWVSANITQKIVDYNSASTSNQRFDGFTLDIEYWLDGGQTTADAVSGLASLVSNMRSALSLPVGVFAPFYFLDNTGTRPSVLYNGKTQQDGKHLVDFSDHVVVGAYRRHANPFSDQNGQIQLFQPWMDYAATAGAARLYCACETTDIGDPNVTFFGASKSDLETEQTLVNASFIAQPKFSGIAVHSYDGWKNLL